MPFSVRVHPAPFSPTPNRHAGIKLEMKGGGPGGSRLGQRSLASSIPGIKHTKGPVLLRGQTSCVLLRAVSWSCRAVMRFSFGKSSEPKQPFFPSAPGLLQSLLQTLSFLLSVFLFSVEFSRFMVLPSRAMPSPRLILRNLACLTHIIIIRPERRSFHKCGAQMSFLQLPAASPPPW